MKKWLAVLTLCFVILFGEQMSLSAAAPVEIKLTPAQLTEIQLEKEQTKKAGQLKKVDLSMLEEVAKAKGLHPDQLVTKQGNGQVGTTGDILVTLSDKSSSSFLWVGGHAGIVSTNSRYTVESFGNKTPDKNGVRRWDNDWANRYSMVRGLWVKGAKSDHYRKAAEYSVAQIGKPYNYNFFDVETTSAFYCSQLVWRAWYNAKGVDLNDGGAVWPVDLIESPHTTVFYSQGQ